MALRKIDLCGNLVGGLGSPMDYHPFLYLRTIMADEGPARFVSKPAKPMEIERGLVQEELAWKPSG